MKTARRSLLSGEKPRKPGRLNRRRQRSFPQVLPLVLLGLGGVLLAATLIFAIRPAEAQAVQIARAGKPLGDFTLMDLSGHPVRLSDYKGRPVLINAWATWCPPCRAEMPALNTYYQQHADEGFVILAVNAGDSQADAAAFAQDYGLAFPVLLDPEIDLLSRMGIHSFPTSILVGRDGVVKDIHIGLFTPEQIEAKVGRLLEQ